MSNLSYQQTNASCIAMALLIPLFFCFPLSAEERPSRPAPLDEMAPKSLKFAALAPSDGDIAAVPGDGSGRRELRGKLDQAIALLKDLRYYGDTAQQIILMADDVRALRSENQHLEQAIADEMIIRDRLNQKRIGTQAGISSLAATVVANWLEAQALSHDIARHDKRLITIGADWATSEARLALLQRQAAHHSRETGALRARSAALAAEIGRTRRQIINVTREIRAVDDDRQAINMATRQLRHDVAAKLRFMLAIKGPGNRNVEPDR